MCTAYLCCHYILCACTVLSGNLRIDLEHCPVDADFAGHTSTAHKELVISNAVGGLTVTNSPVSGGKRLQDAVNKARQASDSAQAEAGVDNPVRRAVDGTGPTVASDAAFLQQWSACPITKVCLLLVMHPQLFQGCV